MSLCSGLFPREAPHAFPRSPACVPADVMWLCSLITPVALRVSSRGWGSLAWLAAAWAECAAACWCSGWAHRSGDTRQSGWRRGFSTGVGRQDQGRHSSPAHSSLLSFPPHGKSPLEFLGSHPTFRGAGGGRGPQGAGDVWVGVVMMRDAFGFQGRTQSQAGEIFP